MFHLLTVRPPQHATYWPLDELKLNDSSGLDGFAFAPFGHSRTPKSEYDRWKKPQCVP
jgi:hypothetical protein